MTIRLLSSFGHTHHDPLARRLQPHCTGTESESQLSRTYSYSRTNAGQPLRFRVRFFRNL